jgi:Outer membrane protein beta-barrel domain
MIAAEVAGRIDLISPAMFGRPPFAPDILSVLSVGYRGGRLAFEFDFQRYHHLFKDSEVFPLDPAAPPNCVPAVSEARRPCTDIDTDAMGIMGNVLASVRIHGVTKWRPYGTAGLGLIRAWTNEQGRHQNNFAFNAGVGVMYSLRERVGLRGDLRYFARARRREQT